MAPSVYTEKPVLEAISVSEPSTTSNKLKRRRSILKSDSFEEQHISTDEACWISLPAPKIASSSKENSRSLSLSHDSTECCKEKRKSVSFNEIHLRIYDQTLGDHPSTQDGPPITLDWSYEDAGVYDLEDYEEQRYPDSCGVKRMSELKRKLILMRCYGFEMPELRKAARTVRRQNFRPKMERAIERIGYKTRSILRLKLSPSA